MSIGKPAADGHSMLRVENIGSGRVVDDDGILEVPANLGEVLDIVAAVVMTTLSEEPVVNHAMNVQLVKQRVAILLVLVSKNC